MARKRFPNVWFGCMFVVIIRYGRYNKTVFFVHLLFFYMQKLINMKMYDKQLYANVEDLVV